MLVGLEPCPDISVFVVLGVVLNQNCSLAAVPASQLFEEAEIGVAIEDGVLAIVEPCAPKFDCAENLHALPLSRHWDIRRASYAAPGGVKRRVLAETGFVCEDERPVSRAGFFLRAG